MQYFLEHDQDSLKFLDQHWPELDRFHSNNVEPQQAFLWALAHARHHKRSKRKGQEVTTPVKPTMPSGEELKTESAGDESLVDVHIPSATIDIAGELLQVKPDL